MEQTVSFEMLGFENINGGKAMSPTDIDVIGSVQMAADINGRFFMFYELKYEDTPFKEKTGQMFLFTAMVDAIERGGGAAVLAFAHHSVKDTNKSIIAADCIIKRFYLKGKWQHASCTETIGEYMKGCLQFYKKIAPDG